MHHMPYSFLYYVYKVYEFAHNYAQNVLPAFFPIIKPANMQILTSALAHFSAENFIYRTHGSKKKYYGGARNYHDLYSALALNTCIYKGFLI
jgi:hypothetical protein